MRTAIASLETMALVPNVRHAFFFFLGGGGRAWGTLMNFNEVL